MMKAVLLSILISMSLAVSATQHSMCWNHFLKKDGCVRSAASDKTRCKAPAKDVSKVHVFTKSPKALPKQHHLEKRYDTTDPVFPILGPTTEHGVGICGHYNSSTQLGVCLWSGPGPSAHLDNAGWVNGAKTSNCGKRVYLQLKGKPDTVEFVDVIDGCSFNAKYEKDGCHQLALTIALAKKLSAKGSLDQGITWDFDNLHGSSSAQAPV